jgi:hypothetical protein
MKDCGLPLIDTVFTLGTSVSFTPFEDKGSCLCAHHEGIWGSGSIGVFSLTSALVGIEWSTSRPGDFTFVKEYVSRWAPETVGAFWKREKSLGSAGN